MPHGRSPDVQQGLPDPIVCRDEWFGVILKEAPLCRRVLVVVLLREVFVVMAFG